MIDLLRSNFLTLFLHVSIRLYHTHRVPCLYQMTVSLVTFGAWNLADLLHVLSRQPANFGDQGILTSSFMSP